MGYLVNSFVSSVVNFVCFSCELPEQAHVTSNPREFFVSYFVSYFVSSLVSSFVSSVVDLFVSYFVSPLASSFVSSVVHLFVSSFCEFLCEFFPSPLPPNLLSRLRGCMDIAIGALWKPHRRAIEAL